MRGEGAHTHRERMNCFSRVKSWIYKRLVRKERVAANTWEGRSELTKFGSISRGKLNHKCFWETPPKQLLCEGHTEDDERAKFTFHVAAKERGGGNHMALIGTGGESESSLFCLKNCWFSREKKGLTPSLEKGQRGSESNQGEKIYELVEKKTDFSV